MEGKKVVEAEEKEKKIVEGEIKEEKKKMDPTLKIILAIILIPIILFVILFVIMIGATVVFNSAV